MIHYTCDACNQAIDLNKSKIEDIINVVLTTGYASTGAITGKLEHVCVPCQRKMWIMLTTKP